MHPLDSDTVLPKGIEPTPDIRRYESGGKNGVKGAYHHQHEIIYYYIVHIQFIYGLRLGEVCALEWSDIDFQKGILRLTGTMEWYGMVKVEKRKK